MRVGDSPPHYSTEVMTNSHELVKLQSEIDILKMNETHLQQIVREKTDIIGTQNAEINVLRARLQMEGTVG